MLPREDGHRCRYCGATAADGAKLTVDHVTPVALGGSHDPTNLVTACDACNNGKTSTSPDSVTVAQVSDDAVRWARAMAEAAGALARDAYERDTVAAAVDHAWKQWKNANGDHMPRPRDWKGSVASFTAASLTAHDLVELVDVAMNSKASDPWRYFCGCAWKRVGQLQDLAKEILAAEQPPPAHAQAAPAPAVALPHACRCEGVEPETPYPHRSPEHCGAYMDGVYAGRRAVRDEVALEEGRTDWHLEQVVDQGYSATAAMAVEFGRSNFQTIWAA